MRPRVFPAEDPSSYNHTNTFSYASMRPRVFPAEDVQTGAVYTVKVSGFNEAAGIPRGRLRRGGAA